ncbi:hypothetical protein D3C80_1179360 [compost metagenome]
MQYQYQYQGDQAQAQAYLLHAAKLITHRGVILGDTDRNGLAKAPVIAAQHQQLLVLRAELQIGVQAATGWRRHVQVPKRPGTPAATVEIDAKVIAGERPLVGRGKPPLIQLQARLPAHQRDQQVFAFLAQTCLQVALQAHLEQPQTQLRQGQTYQHQYRNQAKTQACLDRLHSLLPA